MKNKKTNEKAASSGKKSFYIIYAIIVAIALAAIAVLAVYLRGVLVRYEKGIPSYSVDDVFAEIFGSDTSEPDYYRIFEGSGVQLSPFETTNEFIRAYNDLVDGRKLSYREMSNGLSESRKFAVFAGDDKIGYFFIDPAENEKMYEIGDVNIKIEAAESVCVKTLSGNKILLNGMSVGEEYKRTTSAAALDGMLPDGSVVQSAVYRVNSLLQKPKISVSSADGETISLSYDENTRTYTDETLTRSGTLKIKTIASSSLLVAGKPVSEDYFTGEIEKTDSCNHVPEGVEGISYKYYSIKWIDAQPTFSATDRYGKEAVFDPADESGVYCEKINYNEAKLEEKRDYVIDAVTTYAKYMTNDATGTQLSSYFDRKSDLYYYITHADTWTNAKKHSCTIKDASAKDLYVYSDEIFSVSISFMQLIDDQYGSTEHFPFDQTVYFKKSGSKYVVYDLIANTAK